MKYFFTACIIFVVFALGIGFYFSGTPGNARAERLDELRVSNLANIENNIVEFYRTKKQLPSNMNELVQSQISNFYTDPETQVLYEYNKKSDTEFSLCATFALEMNLVNDSYPYYYSVPTMPGIVGDNTWKHPAGHVCFDRKIDPSLLKDPYTGMPSVPVKG